MVCLPAAVLFLSASNRHAAELFVAIEYSIHPLRAVSLIDPLPPCTESMNITFRALSSTDPWPDPQLGPTSEDDEKLLRCAYQGLFRTREPDRWKEVALQLMDHVPIVVIDTRISTKAVIFEAEYMLTATRARRTLRIVEEGKRHANLLSLVSGEAREIALHSSVLFPEYMALQFLASIRTGRLRPHLRWSSLSRAK